MKLMGLILSLTAFSAFAGEKLLTRWQSVNPNLDGTLTYVRPQVFNSNQWLTLDMHSDGGGICRLLGHKGIHGMTRKSSGQPSSIQAVIDGQGSIQELRQVGYDIGAKWLSSITCIE